MDVSPNALRKEIVATLKEVNEMLDQIPGRAGAHPTRSGAYPVSNDRASLLLAKSECLNALVGLQGKK